MSDNDKRAKDTKNDSDIKHKKVKHDSSSDDETKVTKKSHIPISSGRKEPKRPIVGNDEMKETMKSTKKDVTASDEMKTTKKAIKKTPVGNDDVKETMKTTKKGITANDEMKTTKKAPVANDEMKATKKVIKKAPLANDEMKTADIPVQSSARKETKKTTVANDETKETKKTIAENTPPKRGRKTIYATEEERIEARRQNQRNYRARKKQEMEELKIYKQSSLKKTENTSPSSSETTPREKGKGKK